MKRLGAALIALALTWNGGAAGQGVQVASDPIPLYPTRPDDRIAGRLLYRGGLVLSSRAGAFGGWSGLTVSADGLRILAISDEAHWLTGRLVYDIRGDLAGLTDAEIFPMLGIDGQPMEGKDGDAEGLAAITPNWLDGPVLVSFEREHRIWRYDLSSGVSKARPALVPIGSWTQILGENEGMEGIVLLEPGAFLVISENGLDANGDLRAAIESYSRGGMTQLLGLARHPPYMVTDAALTHDGSLLILERRFTIAGGIGMELRKLDARLIREGARLTGEIVAELAAHDANIDNMEGLAVRRGADGETLVYVMSDNNYQPLLQRTLLLMFQLERE